MKSLNIKLALLSVCFAVLLPSVLSAQEPIERCWVARYDGASISDLANAIAVDEDGNVYVTGKSYNNATHYDFATVKYNNDGIQQWVATYNGPGDYIDEPLAIAVDAAGNVYVAGQINITGPAPYNADFGTIKYDADGNHKWVRTYNNSTGDSVFDIAVDSEGNVYVTGTNYHTIKYDADGNQKWVRREVYGYNANAIAIDADNNVYVTGEGRGYYRSDFFTVKYDADGNKQWLRKYNGPANMYEMAEAIAVDSEGNVYVTGRSDGSGTYDDYATVKYDAAGNELWNRRYNGPGNYHDVPHAIAIDADNNVYVTGESKGLTNETHYDFATIKYNSDGTEEWVVRYSDRTYYREYAYDIAVDTNGGVYVTGLNQYNYGTVKYDSSGIQQWEDTYNGPGSHIDYATAIALDAEGNAYVTGWSYGGWRTSYDYATIKYCPANHAPVANAGPNLGISSEEVATTTIQGTATDEDPDDVLEYQWKEGETILLAWTPVGENGACPLDLSTTLLGIGTHTLTLEVSDGQATSSDDMILTIENSAPHAAPTGSGVYEINTEVTLGGSVSDFDGELLQYQWMEGTDVLSCGQVQAIAGGTPVNLEDYATPNFALGMHSIILQVTDGINAPVSSGITVEIVDTTVPTLAPAANRSILWPPNREMVDIVIQANAVDNSGLPVTLTAVVSSNEPVDGLGDGDTAPDWTEPVIDQDNGIITLQLRAERSGTGNGRVYTVTITATDGSGNTSTVDLELIVPHDNRKQK